MVLVKTGPAPRLASPPAVGKPWPPRQACINAYIYMLAYIYVYIGVYLGKGRFTLLGYYPFFIFKVLYPDMYNGAWVSCPDPLDFRAYTSLNLYNGLRMKKKNMMCLKCKCSQE